MYFNPRTPCGVRLQRRQPLGRDNAFQSTHPLRGATCQCSGGWYSWPVISIHAPLAGCDDKLSGSGSGGAYFNPRTPCGVRRDDYCRNGCCPRISIHAPLAGCDAAERLKNAQAAEFQSTHPLRGATRRIKHNTRNTRYFNPRTPCGVRLLERPDSPDVPDVFQSTHPLRGATRATCHSSPRTI